METEPAEPEADFRADLGGVVRPVLGVDDPDRGRDDEPARLDGDPLGDDRAVGHVRDGQGDGGADRGDRAAGRGGVGLRRRVGVGARREGHGAARDDPLDVGRQAGLGVDAGDRDADGRGDGDAPVGGGGARRGGAAGSGAAGAGGGRVGVLALVGDLLVDACLAVAVLVVGRGLLGGARGGAAARGDDRAVS